MKIPKGKWEFSEFYRDVYVAHEWGFQDPVEFWKLPKLSRTLMIAYVMSSGSMQGFEMEQK